MEAFCVYTAHCGSVLDNGVVCIVYPILVCHVMLVAIWLQPSTVPTKHLGCDLQCGSCQHVALSRNRMDTECGNENSRHTDSEMCFQSVWL